MADEVMFSKEELEGILDEESPEDDLDAGKTTQKGGRRKPYVYKDRDDISILREVILEKPSKKTSAKKWKIIFERLSLPVPDYRSLRCRFENLLKAFKEDNLKSMKGSGTEEDYDEKAQLLTEIVSEIDDWESEAANEATKGKRKQEEEIRRAQNIRQAAAETIEGGTETKTQSDADTPTRKRQRPSDYLEVIKAQEERSHEMELVKVDMEKRRLDMMERELKMKEEGEAHRRDMEQRQLKLEEQRMKNDQERLRTEREEKSLLMKLLEKSLLNKD